MYNPGLWKLLVLLITALVLPFCAARIKQRWSLRGEVMPLSIALLLWLGMFSIYLAVLSALFFSYTPATAPPNATEQQSEYAEEESLPGEQPLLQGENIDKLRGQVPLLAYALILFIFPAFYFTMLIVNALAGVSMERISPLSAQIEEPSEFAAARKLALNGNIDGAVTLYRNYSDDQANALFEAARLLKSEDRYVEAGLLLEEIMDFHEDDHHVWADATYQLAKLQENKLGNHETAQKLLQRIVQQAPETRFCNLATADLARLKVLMGSLADEEEEEVEADDTHIETLVHRAAPDNDDDDLQLNIPPQDPFYISNQESPKAKKPASKKSAAKKKAPAKKKAVAKKKAAAKKKAPAKKKAATKKKSS